MWTAPHVIRLTTITLRHFGAGERAPATTSRADSCIAAIYGLQCSLNHLVGEREQPIRHVESESLRSFEVDDQLEFCGLHNWQVGRFLTVSPARTVLQQTPPARPEQGRLSGGRRLTGVLDGL